MKHFYPWGGVVDMLKFSAVMAKFAAMEVLGGFHLGIILLHITLDVKPILECMFQFMASIQRLPTLTQQDLNVNPLDVSASYNEYHYQLLSLIIMVLWRIHIVHELPPYA